jgi:hypothetical protein
VPWHGSRLVSARAGEGTLSCYAWLGTIEGTVHIFQYVPATRDGSYVVLFRMPELELGLCFS